MELVWGKMKTPNLPYRLVAMRYKPQRNPSFQRERVRKTKQQKRSFTKPSEIGREEEREREREREAIFATPSE